MKARFQFNRIRLFTILIVIFPILNTSLIGSLYFGFGDLFLLIGYFLLIFSYQISGRFKLKKNQFMLFMIYFFFVSTVNSLTISGFSISNTITRFLRYLFYSIIIFQCDEYIDWDYGFKFYIKVCCIESIYLLIQFALSLLNIIDLPYVFPYAMMEYHTWGATYNAQLRDLFRNETLRGVGFFPEASHFAQYTIFSIPILLYSDLGFSKKNTIAKFILISVSILLTFSSIGIFGYLATILIYVCSRLKTRKQIIRGGVLLLLAILLVVFFSFKLNLFDFVMERLRGIAVTRYPTSGNQRLMRGFYIFSDLPTVYKIFGIGCGNFTNAMKALNVHTIFDEFLPLTNEFMSGISTVMVDTGIIGTLLFIRFYIHQWRIMDIMHKVFMINIMIALVTENSFFQSIFVFSMCLLITSKSIKYISKR